MASSRFRFFPMQSSTPREWHPRRRLDARYVRAAAVLEGVELFDASFFKMPARDAQITDPQHRLFLECAWHALENAGCDPHRFHGEIGVFAGAARNAYFVRNISRDEMLKEALDDYQIHDRQRERLSGDACRLQIGPAGTSNHRANGMFDVAGGGAHGVSAAF